MPREWKNYTTLQRLDNLEVLKALFYSHAYGRHFHEGYALGVILKGSETYACNKKTNVAPQGSVVIVNPGEIHDGQASDTAKGWGYFMIYPKLSLIQKALRQMEMDHLGLPVFPESVIFDKGYADLVLQFMASVEEKDSRLTLEARFLEMLSLLISRHARFGNPPAISASGSDPKIRKIMELLREDFDRPLTLDYLACEVSLSPWALLRLFKRRTGLTPYLIQTRLRLNRAKAELFRGTAPADAAALCGFTDQSHMTRQFRKWMGITPGDVAVFSGKQPFGPNELT